VGHASEPKHGLKPEQEDLRPDRGLKIYAHIEAWRNRRVEGAHPYLVLMGS
jgi:hypothetical protein